MQGPKRDEYGMFANLIGEKLRKIDCAKRTVLMHEIHGLILQAEITSATFKTSVESTGSQNSSSFSGHPSPSILSYTSHVASSHSSPHAQSPFLYSHSSSPTSPFASSHSSPYPPSPYASSQSSAYPLSPVNAHLSPPPPYKQNEIHTPTILEHDNSAAKDLRSYVTTFSDNVSM